MSDVLQRPVVVEEDGSTVVMLYPSTLYEESMVQEVGELLFDLVEKQRCVCLLIDFANVVYVGSLMIAKLIVLDKKMKAVGGSYVLVNIRPEIYEVFAITKLNRLFPIKDSREEGLKFLGEALQKGTT